eukprot:1161226-Pelagomonas_calceolata.AAC.14
MDARGTCKLSSTVSARARRWVWEASRRSLKAENSRTCAQQKSACNRVGSEKESSFAILDGASRPMNWATKARRMH